jgi:hypothetical protein
MNVCKGCKQIGKTKVITMDEKKLMFNREILVKDIPVIHCEECNHMEYVYPRELEFQIRDAYRNGEDTITFKLEK